jgi:hypothetical protein
MRFSNVAVIARFIMRLVSVQVSIEFLRPIKVPIIVPFRFANFVSSDFKCETRYEI